MVECTGLENQQSRKVLVGSNPTASATLLLAGGLLAVVLTACTSIPGESMAHRSIQRDVREKVLAQARAADPQCKQPRIGNTEILDVYADGRSSQELWSVEGCGRRLNYLVGFPPKRDTGTSMGFTVRPER